MTERTYLTSIVALILIRECLVGEHLPDRKRVVEAAREYVRLREHHNDLIRMLAAERDGHPDRGLLIANERGHAAAEFVLRTFEDDAPDTDETYVLGDSAEGDRSIALALQHVYDVMEHPLRQRVKDTMRRCAELASEPLDAEVTYMLEMLDSWEAWELSQQLDT